MSIKHVNRKGKTYYLYQKQTKTGKLKYFFSTKSGGTPVDSIPEGYEIYENPNAQVFLRKITPKVFSEDELKIVEQGIKQYAKLEYFQIDVKQNAIVVYLPNQDVNSIKDLFARYSFGLLNNSEAENRIFDNMSYSPMMRFVLEDQSERKFRVERMCFRGPEDHWWYLERGNDLGKLVKKYAKHLGQESFYDLI